MQCVHIWMLSYVRSALAWELKMCFCCYFSFFSSIIHKCFDKHRSHLSPSAFQVTWDKKGVGPIAISDAIFIRDNRYSIRRSRVSDWALVIHSVRPEDSGTYRCQINLSKLKEKVFSLKVEGELEDQQKGIQNEVWV